MPRGEGPRAWMTLGLRVSPELHTMLATLARDEGVSLNCLAVVLLADALRRWQSGETVIQVQK